MSSIVIFPFVISPFWVSKSPVIALKAVVLPEPLLPNRETILPFGTSKETPLKTKITSWYTTSKFWTDKMPDSLITCTYLD